MRPGLVDSEDHVVRYENQNINEFSIILSLFIKICRRALVIGGKSANVEKETENTSPPATEENEGGKISDGSE